LPDVPALRARTAAQFDDVAARAMELDGFRFFPADWTSAV